MAELPLQSITIGSNKYILSGSGSVDSTSEPTADTVAEFDSDAHMNSTDMDASEISDFVDGLNVGSNFLCELIYDGSFTSGTTTLYESIAEYSKLYIVFEDNDGCIHTQVILTNRATSIQTILSFDRITSAEYRKSMLLAINGATLTSSSNYQAAGTATPTSGSYIIIKKIYGVKPYVTDVILEQADYVIAQGTSGIWKYRKWNSGDVELWGVYSATLTHYATVNSWYGYNTGSVSLPFTVYSPETQISAKVGSGFAHSGNCYSTSNSSSISTITGYCIANQSGSQSTVWHFDIKGRWK